MIGLQNTNQTVLHSEVSSNAVLFRTDPCAEGTFSKLYRYRGTGTFFKGLSVVVLQYDV